MKILYLNMRFAKNGLSTNIRDLTRGMIEDGHEMHIVTTGFWGKDVTDTSFFDDLKKEFKDLGVHIHYMANPTGNSLKKVYNAIKGFVQVISYIRKINPDVIHSHSPNMTFVPYLMGKKFVSTVHADTITPNFRYKHPTLLIAVSEGSKEFTKRVMHSPEKTIRMVYHGIDKRFSIPETKESILSLKEKNGIPKDKLIIGAVGRIIAMKGQDVLLNAIGQYLSPDLKQKIHIVLVGDYESKHTVSWLDNFIKANQVEDQITILSFRDPKPYYQMFDIFVLPSRSDTFGLVAVEAMMSGCCTIRSDSNGAYDQINHGENGFIFEMDDAKGLASYLDKVLNNKKLRNKLSVNGKQKALTQFTQKAMVDNTLKVYEELINMN
ncbi:glycosyltransferase involved in cell wall biosynthesis [Maribacter caenipelagi]|uniref:Glycosyltransferase involved in cell wall biosynthesis n=1 Tax=Maribacter caenipelagi TaxID=1447781 RepID=A0A4R7CXZ0_9FLAO|nr:glycosyltransferase family 4 protein [Maribacter caenipelagi]TDS13429.1 glycosyltransferase involved in cell wall biosynthesis [Maribacter caenipelagi]